MKLLIKTFYFIFVTFLVASCQKYDDESRPYEFGFTIDGQQHRHEKKDVNGIIQGEFGFITADGIYHVTVYATDENGNFKILSMKNIRISAPLDGSPLPEGQRISDNPNVNQGQINLSPQTSPVSQRSPVYQNSPIVKPLVQNLPRPLQNIPRPLQNLPPPTPTKTSRGPYAFTTQPTIKPACGGCGYITTSKPKPGQQAFPFQTPAFQSLPENKPRDSGGQIQSERYSAISNPLSAYPNPKISNSGSGLTYPVQPILQQNLFNEPIKSLGKTDAIPAPELFNNPIKNTGKVETIPGSEPSYPAGTKPGAIQPSYPRPNEINSPKRQSPLSRVSVSNGAIHVPGNPDIPIRDKYPGMVDGLPKGITEKDITDLLYKFNYTIGFHGHYEKGLKNGAKIGGYFVNGRDGISRIVTYVADENGFRPKVKFVRLDLNSDDVPKEGTEKRFGLKNFEFVWYPVS